MSGTGQHPMPGFYKDDLTESMPSGNLVALHGARAFVDVVTAGASVYHRLGLHWRIGSQGGLTAWSLSLRESPFSRPRHTVCPLLCAISLPYLVCVHATLKRKREATNRGKGPQDAALAVAISVIVAGSWSSSTSVAVSDSC